MHVQNMCAHMYQYFSNAYSKCVICSFSSLPLSYLSEGVGYLITCLRRERERAVALRSMGLMVYVLKDRMDLDPVLTTIRTNLPGIKDLSTGK